MTVLGDLHYDTSPETVYHAKFIETSTFAFRQGPNLCLVLDFNLAESQTELAGLRHEPQDIGRGDAAGSSADSEGCGQGDVRVRRSGDGELPRRHRQAVRTVRFGISTDGYGRNA